MAHDFTGAQTPPAQAQGRRPAPPTQLADRLPHAPTPYFQFRSHPMRWMMVKGPAGPEWLPILSQMRHDLGVGGVDKQGGTDHALIDSAKRQWTVLPDSVMPGGYIRVHDCAGGLYHCTVWETPQHLGEMVLESEIDQEGYYDFLRLLIRDGHIPAPSPAVVSQVQIDQQRKRYQQVLKDRNASEEIRADELQRLEDMQTATDALTAPRKGRKSKTPAADL